MQRSRQQQNSLWQHSSENGDWVSHWRYVISLHPVQINPRRNRSNRLVSDALGSFACIGTGPSSPYEGTLRVVHDMVLFGRLDLV